MNLKFSFLLLLLTGAATILCAQPCTTLGQTPSTAFPVCGTTTFHQSNVPICSSTSLFVPGCSGDGANYENKNPFWYKFTCYTAGTLSFVISPDNMNDDYDWQLYDVTGLSPDAVFTNRNIIISGNWSATPGNTGASATGVTHIQCASAPQDNRPNFARSPNLIAGHEYILLVSHYTDSQSGYDLSFGGGTAVITDPKEPHLQSVTTSCDGTQLRLKLNKAMKCNSLSGNGSEFSIFPANATVTAVTAVGCNAGFNTEEVLITLSNPLPSASYSLIINNGSDGNTMLDNCDRGIPAGESLPFVYTVPQPIPIDSVARLGCAPRQIKLHFSKKIDCSTIAADGSNFSITGPEAVNIIGATGTCTDGLSDIVTLTLALPISIGGTYTVTPRLSVGGGAVRDECGQIIQPTPITFTATDTVNAGFTYTNTLGCRFDTLDFFHDGAHQVNKWWWSFNNNATANTATARQIFSASSTNTVSLIVSNGVCSDTARQTIVLDNEVVAAFVMPGDICPEDNLTLENTSTGLIDSWQWNFETLGTSNIRSPLPLSFIQDNRERIYTIKLTATNNTLGCSDVAQKKLRVLNNCYIAVPNAFTPNGDRINDIIRPNNAVKAQNLRFSIYNRWGQRVFTMTDWKDGWDGKVNGVEQGTGIYVWHLSYTHRDTGEQVFQKGTLTLIK